MVIDIACGMEVDPDDPAATVEYEGKSYHFCSEGCKDHFEADPARFVEADFPFLQEIEGMRTTRMPYGGTPGEFHLSVADEHDLGVGDEVTLTRQLGEDEADQFAKITSDTNALHLNEEFAARTRFGGRILHGTLVAGLISAALAAFPGMTIYLDQHLEFVAPASMGDTYTARCTVVDELAKGRYRVSTRVENGDGDIVVQGTATILIDEMPTQT
ncbi:MaoC/PaaZ C-terminal domain-containing protein [Halorientalis sp. IM1011]|uniref:MaoC/PaaZ C-terminal domain-containing protein n=1 Tax=Halorientalis sp. IM1011 TaxID=1932360 RepID=UPI000A02BC6F|nr:MaoC/PaaZ C-terminal domain-containing protein [Halorientalis sp. IM1011]